MNLEPTNNLEIVIHSHVMEKEILAHLCKWRKKYSYLHPNMSDIQNTNLNPTFKTNHKSTCKFKKCI